MPVIILQALKYWKLIGVGLLVLALGFQTVRYERQKAATAHSETARAQQVSEYREAYNRAVATALAAKEAKEKEFEHARQVSAATYADLSGKYRAIVLRQATANSSRPRFPDLPGDPHGPGLPPESSGGSRFSISTSDALICADNTAYAQGAFEWAKGLQEAPVSAIP